MQINEWTKATFSGPQEGGNCVEVNWKKSTRSGAAGHCVEVRGGDDLIQVRDTKDNGTGPILGFTGAEWDAFIAGAKAGEFDRV